MMPDTETSLPNQVAQFHLRDRLMRVEWAKRRPVLTVDGWQVFVDPGDMPTWVAWVRRIQGIVVVGTETYLTLSGHAPALARFLRDVIDWPKDGLIRLPLDGVYRDAAVGYANVTGNDIVRAKDGITTLEERAARLLNYASDMVDRPDDRHLAQTVASELVDVADDLAELETRLGRLRTVVGLARHQATARIA